MSEYPRPEPWRAWPADRQIAYLESLVETQRKAIARIRGHWLRAAERVKELENS